jgi:hypothetical protein
MLPGVIDVMPVGVTVLSNEVPSAERRTTCVLVATNSRPFAMPIVLSPLDGKVSCVATLPEPRDEQSLGDATVSGEAREYFNKLVLYPAT